MTALGIVLSLWWATGFLSFFAFCIFRYEEITVEDVFVSLIATALGAITLLMMLALCGGDRVLWKKKK
jgi:hypothetical protein